MNLADSVSYWLLVEMGCLGSNWVLETQSVRMASACYIKTGFKFSIFWRSWKTRGSLGWKRIVLWFIFVLSTSDEKGEVGSYLNTFQQQLLIFLLDCKGELEIFLFSQGSSTCLSTSWLVNIHFPHSTFPDEQFLSLSGHKVCFLLLSRWGTRKNWGLYHHRHCLITTIQRNESPLQK